MSWEINQSASADLNQRLDRAVDGQRQEGLPQGAVVGEVHSSPATRLYVANYIQTRADEERPLSHLFLEVPSTAQPLLDRFMRREAGADDDLDIYIQNNASFPDGFYELCEAARNAGTRIVAMDVPESDMRSDIRQTQSNPYWRDVIQREMSTNPDGQFLVLGGEAHMNAIGGMLDIPRFRILDVHAADILATYRRDDVQNPDTPTDRNFLEFSDIPDISAAQIEGRITSHRIDQIGDEYTVLVPDITGYRYEDRAYMLAMDNVSDRSPISEDLGVYRRLNAILYNDDLNERSDSLLQDILQQLAAPGQASTGMLESSRLADNIDRLAEIGNLTPLDRRSLEALADDIRER